MNELERLVDEKIKPLLEEAMHKNLGITINELELDISDRLKKSAVLDFAVDTTIPFKTAKRRFKQHYVARLLQLNSGNVADVARVANIDRRSIHRLVAEQKIDVIRLREAIATRTYAKQHVRDIIENSLGNYKSALNPKRYDAFSKYASTLSENIINVIPDTPKPLKDAEREFEIAFFTKALREHKGNISKTARAIGLRFETLHRKLKSIGLDAKVQ